MDAFTPVLHHILRHVLTTQSPRIHVPMPAGSMCAWVLQCDLQDWVWLSDSMNLSNKRAKFVHKKHCVSSSITQSARQSQIVADKMNTANRYE